MKQDDPGVLRKRLRALRRDIPSEPQRRAAAALFDQIRDLDCYRESHRLACYMAIDGEASPAQLLQDALTAGKHCYLPRVTGADRLEFIGYQTGDRLVKSAWGIPEPAAGERIRLRELDLVLVPLVGFSRECGRLGSGKGFYDRAFAYRLENPLPGPMLLGLAHECQLLASLPLQAWDVPLDAVVTPERIYWR